MKYLVRKKKIFYFCPRGLGGHLHTYTGWILEARKNNLPISLFTTISFKEYFKMDNRLKKKYFIFIPCFKKFDKIIISLFFLFHFFVHKHVIVQIRKRGTFFFEKLKKIIPNKFTYIIESEGDIKYEFEYLENHPYKRDYYSHVLNNKKFLLKRYNESLLKADHIICVSENLKRLYLSRYSMNETKITALTTGCDSNRFYYDSTKREIFRKQLGVESKFVLSYVGSVYFSWQNISRTLEVYKIIKILKPNAVLIIITRESDKPILYDFLSKHNISPEELIIRFSIPNEEIPNYHNAADLGIILRDNHPLNHVAAPGKFGEYLCCGLPILTGIGIADFSEKLKKATYGIVLNNIRDDEELIKKFKEFIINYAYINRRDISLWAAKIFSFQAHIGKYLKLMKRFFKR